MAETNLAFSKIVSTPTPTAWSQAYSAGKVFASFSLETDEVPQEGKEHLSSSGKDLISTFESEFFTLEEKNLDTIKEAIATTISKIRSGIKLSLVLCYLEENVLYLFAIGGGRAVLKRGDKIGTVLEGEADPSLIKPASGYVQEGDIIVLETRPFLSVISSSTLASSLDGETPEEIAENLAPHVHERAEGGAASVVLMYRAGAAPKASDIPEDLNEEKPEEEQKTEEGQTDQEVIPLQDLDEEKTDESEEPLLNEEVTKENVDEVIKKPVDETEETKQPSPFVTADESLTRRRTSPFAFIQRFLTRIPRGRRPLLIIAGALVLLIIVVSLLAINKNSSGQNQQQFTKVLNEAKTKFEEGQNLKDLNASLAQESFRQAKDILEKNEDKFKNNASENGQIQELLSKVNSELGGEGSTEKVSAKEVSKDSSKILSAQIDNSGTFFSENDNNVVFIDKSGISQIDKGNSEKKSIIKKSWETEGGLGTFGSNIYVLDRGDGILKFVPSEDAYSETDYFTAETPDFGDSVSLTIDGSVYVLFKDGSIQKFTRGKADSFELSGLSKSLSSNAKLFTNADSDNLYVLDISNGRIVVLGKTGEFKTAYSADIIKKAKDFDVKEADGKAFILVGDKVYQIDLK